MSNDLTLAVDGSTYAGSVALIRGREVVAERQLELVPHPGKSGKAENFMPMVAECLRDGQVQPSDLARVVCGEGPGSFTSLRVAASIAKGIAAGAGIPLYAVSSLLLIVAREPREDGLWIAALPAMRGEAFVQEFMVDGGAIREAAPARIIRDSDLDREAEKLSARMAGSSAQEMIPHARGAAVVIDAITAAAPCNLDSWEPMYGRLAEAQVKWEAAHGRPLSAAG